jgi:4-hydroxy-tetrahydrodipicolinate synthase
VASPTAHDHDPTPLTGTWFVVPTPFDEHGALDLASQRRLVDAAVSWGVDGLTVMGVMSEHAALTTEERTAALDAIFESAAGRVPIAVGCSSAGAGMSAALARDAGSRGAVAAMVSAPTLVRNLDLLPPFYARVADQGGLPLVVQDEPAATGVTVPVSVLVACLDAASARTVKLEDPPTPPKIRALLEVAPGIDVFGGLGGVSALGEVRAGACGTMTGFAFPEILREVRVAHEAGDRERSAAVFDRYLPLIQFEAQAGIGLAIRKEVLRRREAIAWSATRSAALDPATAAELDDVLSRVGVDPGMDPLVVE